MKRAVLSVLRWSLAGLSLLAMATAHLDVRAQGVEALLAPTRDRGRYLRAIEVEHPAFEVPGGVTGITVPHHLLADDLMARAFWAASAGAYERIILISPDHFRAVRGRFATTDADFDTVFGPLASDRVAVAQLLARGELFESMSERLMAAEHGVQALLPFIKHFWPGARVVPVVASISTEPEDWQAAAEALTPMLDQKTLVVQSTDYSHYLPVGEAVRRDQETLSVIVAADPAHVAPLMQPAHLDSKAAQYIQMRLQERVGSQPVIIANRNQAEYGASPERTTSYVVSIWMQDPALGARLRYADHTRHYFAGDVLLGRYLTGVLGSERGVDAIARVVEPILGGAPLTVNLEGVVLDEVPVGATPDAHVMPLLLAGPALRRLGVTTAGLANNHSADFGPLGISETTRNLSELGIASLRHGDVADLGSFRLLALTALSGRTLLGAAAAGPDDFRVACGVNADPPLIAFVHWGAEYTSTAGDKERAVADVLADCGVSAVVGHHSHRASDRIEPVQGGALQMAFSLGNFVFDQSRADVSGALLELRVFRQKTVAARLIPIPNLFVLGLAEETYRTFIDYLLPVCPGASQTTFSGERKCKPNGNLGLSTFSAPLVHE